ncbi:MAG: NAD+ synthase [Candidatus Nitrosocosmicus sp.]|nr:NAD+ synthase [Candidatus Nitrosocosmicus sp.]
MTSNSMNFESISQEIMNFIKKETDSRKSNGVVLGISGGIDSAVLAYLATGAIGSKKVKGLILPDEDVTPSSDIEDALRICSTLKIDYEKIFINKPKDSFLEIVKDTGNNLLTGNLVARVRMCMLYYYSGQLGRLVLGSSNKTELMLGYFTKYGDGAADLLPLGDLYKTQLVGLANYLEIPDSVIAKKSSARLWADQFTEDDLGLPFIQLDTILQFFEKFHNFQNSVQENISNEFLGLPLEEIQDIHRRMKNNQHKTTFPPICKILK